VKPKEVGTLNQEIIDLLELNVIPDTPILLGDSNYLHMKNSHPAAFEKYFSQLEEILKNPDYVNLNPKDKSIKYIKQINEYVVVGVRISIKGKIFARTIFTFEDWKFKQYKSSGYLKKCNKIARSEDRANPKNSRQGD